MPFYGRGASLRVSEGSPASRRCISSCDKVFLILNSLYISRKMSLANGLITVEARKEQPCTSQDCSISPTHR